MQAKAKSKVEGKTKEVQALEQQLAKALPAVAMGGGAIQAPLSIFYK